jgi:4-amino-4-deoxy-L-arabinose transferase-like glycosyltransferase
VKSPLLPILALAIAVRLGHLLAIAASPLLVYHEAAGEHSDMHVFDEWAHRIVAGDILGRTVYHPLFEWQTAFAPEANWNAWFGERPVFYKAPFYAYLRAALVALFGDSTVPLFLLQVLASAASVALMFRIVAQLWDARAGTFAALLLALYGPDVHFDAVMLRGPWIVLSGLLVTWLLVRTRRDPRPTAAAWLGAATALALLVNEGFALLVPGVALVLALDAGGIRRAVVHVAVFGAAVGGALVPLVVRNLLVGAPPLSLAVTGATVYAVFNAKGCNPYMFDLRPQLYVPIVEKTGGDLLAAAVACLRTFDSPLQVLGFYLQKCVGLVVPFESPDNANFYYFALREPLLRGLVGYAVLFPLACVGGALAARRPRDLAPLAPAALTVLVSILITVPLSRYRAAWAVLLMPLAALALARATIWIEGRRFSALAIAAGGALVIALGAQMLQSQVVFAGHPAGRFLYRETEFANVAHYEARRGAFDSASRELLDLARLNPDRRVAAKALLETSRYQSLLGNTVATRAAIDGAVTLAKGDPVLLILAGDAYRDVLHQAVSAAALYQQAGASPAPPEVVAIAHARLQELDTAKR